MSGGISDIAGTGAVTPVAYQLLGLEAKVTASTTSSSGISTGADYGNIFRDTRTLDTLGLPPFDASVDDGRIKLLVAQLAEIVDSSASEKLRNRTAGEQATLALLLTRLESVDGNVSAQEVASADFAAAVAETPSFTFGSVTSASSAAEIAAITTLTDARIVAANAELAAEEAKGGAADATLVASLTTEIETLGTESARLNVLYGLAVTSEDAQTTVFSAIFSFVVSLMEFFIAFLSGTDEDADAASDRFAGPDGPVGRAFDVITEVARKGERTQLLQMLDGMDRKTLAETLLNEVRVARRENRGNADLTAFATALARRMAAAVLPDFDRTAAVGAGEDGPFVPVAPGLTGFGAATGFAPLPPLLADALRKVGPAPYAEGDVESVLAALDGKAFRDARNLLEAADEAALARFGLAAAGILQRGMALADIAEMIAAAATRADDVSAVPTKIKLVI